MDRPLPRSAGRSSKARRREPLWGRLRLQPGFCLGLALMLLVLPLKWLAAWCLAVAAHELGHLGMLRLLDCRVLGITLGIGGAAIETEPQRRRDEFLCALAGPVAALALLLTARWLPRTAVCAVVQSMYNALPVFPLDGGRAVRCLIRRYVPAPWAERAEALLGGGTLLAVGFLGAAATFLLRLGPVPLLCAGILFIKCGKAKFPCKIRRERVK